MCCDRCLIVVCLSAVFMCMCVVTGVLLLFDCPLSIRVCVLQCVPYCCLTVCCLYVYVCCDSCLIVVLLSAVFMCMCVVTGVLLLFVCPPSLCVCVYYCLSLVVQYVATNVSVACDGQWLSSSLVSVGVCFAVIILWVTHVVCNEWVCRHVKCLHTCLSIIADKAM